MGSWLARKRPAVAGQKAAGSEPSGGTRGRHSAANSDAPRCRQRAGPGTKGRGRACAQRPPRGRGLAPRPRPLALRAHVTVASRRSCHGGAERPGVGAGVLQGPRPPGEAGAERARRSRARARAQRRETEAREGRGRSGSSVAEALPGLGSDPVP